ncbi:MAG: group III truncated hemoglobin [Bacteroidia bacterium]|nr:group III truncated hemoglobin [Bacteroidia bacterium]MCZ2249443.1 group III truncated hemoglobin [Bacteroidia bacterium]
MGNDILEISDIKLLVNSFYEKVRKDSLLAHIFNDRIQDRWPLHLQKMYRFWQTVLLDEHTYEGRPFPPHANLPVDKTHFNRWLELFYETIDENFEGVKAQEAKWRAERMAELFYEKIIYIQNNPGKVIL